MISSLEEFILKDEEVQEAQRGRLMKPISAGPDADRSLLASPSGFPTSKQLQVVGSAPADAIFSYTIIALCRK
jgi:hypothetical protein